MILSFQSIGQDTAVYTPPWMQTKTSIFEAQPLIFMSHQPLSTKSPSSQISKSSNTPLLPPVLCESPLQLQSPRTCLRQPLLHQKLQRQFPTLPTFQRTYRLNSCIYVSHTPLQDAVLASDRTSDRSWG